MITFEGANKNAVLFAFSVSLLYLCRGLEEFR